MYKRQVPVLAGICLALRNEHAGEFLSKNLNDIGVEDPEQFAEYLRAAARYTSLESVDQVVEAAKRFSDDMGFQLELLRSVDRGLAARGVRRPDSVAKWATRLAKDLLVVDGDLSEMIDWRFDALPRSATETNPWRPSTRRGSADGQKNSRLFSSFPTGEKQTGIFRSAVFEIRDDFDFWMAGHDGYPDKPARKQNCVRLRLASSHAILKTWYPPRNDTAQRFQLEDPGLSKGQRVYVELVDDNSAGAFAWLAVGRFSDERLNPREGFEKRGQGIALIEEMGLTNLRGSLLRIVQGDGFSDAMVYVLPSQWHGWMVGLDWWRLRWRVVFQRCLSPFVRTVYSQWCPEMLRLPIDCLALP